MPGKTIHLWAGKMFLDKVGISRENQLQFYAGTLLPDLSTNKDALHYAKPTQNPFFKNPDVAKAMAVIGNDWSWIRLGIIHHLMLDKSFNSNYLMEKFKWRIHHDNNGICFADVIIGNGKVYNAVQFFSETKGIYKDYTLLNPIIITEYLSDFINDIPEELPLTGIALYDERNYEKTWKEELGEYLTSIEGDSYGFIQLDDVEKFLEAFTTTFFVQTRNVVTTLKCKEGK